MRLPHHTTRTLVRLLACTAGGIAIITGLYLFSDRLNHRPNGFIRLLYPHALQPQATLDLGYNSFYIAGMSNTRVYFGNTTAPFLLTITNHLLSDKQQLSIGHPMKMDSMATGPGLIVDSPRLYLYTQSPATIRTASLSGAPIRFSEPDTSVFNQLQPLSPSSFVLRRYDKAAQQNILQSFSLSAGTRPGNDYRLATQGDGVFSTDGMLLGLPDSQGAVYVYYYRNLFVILDRHLHTLVSGHTIDTNHTAQLRITSSYADKSSVLSGPPPFVNRHACTAGRSLFIHSVLLSNNENRSSFEEASVIDVYDLSNGRYRFSFYIPDFAGQKIKDFKIGHHTLVALYQHDAMSYSIRFPY